MAKSDRLLPAPPDVASEAAEIGRRINDLARRISNGQKQSNDFSDLSYLIRRRAGLLRPVPAEKEKAE